MENLIMLSVGIFASAILFYILGTIEDKKRLSNHSHSRKKPA